MTADLAGSRQPPARPTALHLRLTPGCWCRSDHCSGPSAGRSGGAGVRVQVALPRTAVLSGPRAARGCPGISCLARPSSLVRRAGAYRACGSTCRQGSKYGSPTAASLAWRFMSLSVRAAIVDDRHAADGPAEDMAARIFWRVAEAHRRSLAGRVGPGSAASWREVHVSSGAEPVATGTRVRPYWMWG